VSIPEKFVSNILASLNVDFKTQYCPDWSLGRKYDFYIDSLNLIIETHGRQHYEAKHGNWRKRAEKENDIFKENLARENGFKYLTIDCRESTLEWLSKNCSEQLQIYFDLSFINYFNIYERCQNSYCIETWNLWNSGIKNSIEIANKLKLNKVTIATYLKRGAKIGKIDYDPKEQMVSAAKRATSKPINQYNLSGEFVRQWESENEAARTLGLLAPNISLCANDKQNSTGGFMWKFAVNCETIAKINAYKETKKKPINQYSPSNEFIKRWESAQEIRKQLKIDGSSISRCAKNKQKTAGGFIWKFADV